MRLGMSWRTRRFLSYYLTLAPCFVLRRVCVSPAATFLRFLCCVPSLSEPLCATQRLRVVEEARSAFEHNAHVYTEQVACDCPLTVFSVCHALLPCKAGVACMEKRGRIPRASERCWEGAGMSGYAGVFGNGESPCVVLTAISP